MNGEGICPTPDSVEAILNFLKPPTIAELRRFISIVNFDRLICRTLQLRKPLQTLFGDLCKNDKSFDSWTAEAKEAFIRVKNELAAVALLVHLRTGAEIRIVSNVLSSVYENIGLSFRWSSHLHS